MSNWHRDYVAESIKRLELSRFSEDPSLDWLKFAIECDRVVELAGAVGRETGVALVEDIAATIRKNAGNRYAKITPKQRFVLARVLAEKFGNARGVAAHLWQLTDEEIDNADI